MAVHARIKCYQKIDGDSNIKCYQKMGDQAKKER